MVHLIMGLFLFCFPYFTVYGQGTPIAIDSLQHLLQTDLSEDTGRVDVLNDLGYRYWVINSNESVTYGNEAFELAKKLGYQKGMALAKRVLGVSYWTMGQPKQALEYLKSGQDLYLEINDEEGATNCLMNSGMVYADLGDYEKALEIYDTSIEKFSQLGLDQRIATTFSKIGSVLIEKNQLADAQEYLNNALTMHSKSNYLYGEGEAHNRLGTLFLMQGELEKADHHLRKATEISERIDDQDGIISSLIQSGKLKRLRKDYAAAEDDLKLALQKAEIKHLKKYKLATLQELKLLKKQQGKLGESLIYYDAFTALKDSIYNSDKSKQIAAMEFSNEMHEKNRELAFLNRKKETDALIKWLLVGGLLIITLLSFLLIRSLRLKNKNQQDLLASEDLIAKTIMENQRLKQAELEQQLHFKNKELASYALNFLQKNEMLESLRDKIKMVKGSTADKHIKSLDDIEKVIRQHKSIDKDWEDFKVHFEHIHADFLKKLKHEFPELSGNDLKVVALARLNLSIKEASGILGISPESARTARYRLRKKLGLEQDEDLFSFLLRLEQKNQ